MPEKVSTRGSGAKKGPQKYQNEFAYTHNKGSKTTQKIMALPVDGLCRRCTDQVLWRKQYRKYKPLTVAKKCVSCQLKKVKKAYHVMCDGCARDKGVCAKCMESSKIVEGNNQKTSQERLKEEQELEQKLASMRERERRSYLRKLERGDIVVADVPNVGESDDDFVFSDSDDDDGLDSCESDADK
ncbi:hypothetical protein GGI25_003359 [Coemansia spiralis]|uniref:Uncharacterized protein n=2 Tax=Coemansia TaxID=4863 RepID=A0A9W8G6U3_9FUNG|nr:hypothetical protein BX070DRAFT_21292 [Coemansia spiralis]KAJ1990897.1 hypothetical protein EDC05_003747 [Coemansia umbellata]KAJ2621677.1 hypothetical protein GGI26_003885 [Coemansia sp. RSA 1358]KAJ2676824.1 hypothetical protein GGI25_003359 [Coemansia spiralis]